MRRTIRGRGARGFATKHAYSQIDAFWTVLNRAQDDVRVILVSTASCLCGKHDTRVVDSTPQPWMPRWAYVGDRLEVRRPVDFSACRRLPAVLSLRGAPA